MLYVDLVVFCCFSCFCLEAWNASLLSQCYRWKVLSLKEIRHILNSTILFGIINGSPTQVWAQTRNSNVPWVSKLCNLLSFAVYNILQPIICNPSNHEIINVLIMGRNNFSLLLFWSSCINFNKQKTSAFLFGSLVILFYQILDFNSSKKLQGNHENYLERLYQRQYGIIKVVIMKSQEFVKFLCVFVLLSS